MKRTLSILLSLILMLLIASAAKFFWLLHDQQWVKEQTQKYVSQLAGRALLIDGSLELKLSLHPSVNAENIRLANATWAEAAEFISLERLQVSVDLLSLLSDQVVIDTIALEGLEIDLEKNKQGKVNWDLFPAKTNSDKDRSLPKEQPVRINYLTLNKLHLRHQSPNRLEPLSFALAEFKAERTIDGLTNLHALGSLGELPLTLEAHVGPLVHLISGDAMKMQIHLSLGEIILHVFGKVSNPHTGVGADLAINFSGPEFAWITEKFSLPEFTRGAFDFNLKLESINNIEKFDILGDFGSLDIVANGDIDSLLNPREGQIKFQINGPDLQKLAATFAVQNLLPAAYHFQGNLSARQGIVEIDTLAFEVGETTGQVTGKMGEWPNLSDTELYLNISGPDLSQWGPALRLNHLSASPFSYSGKLLSKGLNVQISNKLKVEENFIELTGNLGQPPNFQNMSLDLDLYFPNLTKVTSLPYHDKMSPVSLTVEGNLGRKGQVLLLNNFRIGQGENKISANAQIVLSEDLHGSQLSGQVEIPDVASLEKYFQREDLSDLSASLNVNMDISAGGLSFELYDSKLSEMAVNMKGTLPDLYSPDHFSAHFQLALPSLRNIPLYPDANDLPDMPSNLYGQVEHQGHQIHLNNLNGSVGASSFDIDGLLVVTEKFTGSDIKFKIAGPDFRPLFSNDKLTTLPGKYRASGRIELGKDRDLLQNLELSLGDMHATLNGSVDDLRRITSAQLSASLNLPSLSKLDGFMNRDFPDASLSMNTVLTGRGSHFILQPLQAKLGSSDLSGTISLDLRTEPSIEGKLSSDFLDIAWLTKTKKSKQKPVKPVKQVFPDEPISYPGFGNVNMQLDLSAERLKMHFTELSGVKLDLSAHKKYLDIEAFEFAGPLGGRVSGKLAMNATKGVTHLDFGMHGKQVRLKLEAAEGQDIKTLPKSDIAIELQGNGATYHQLASSLNGQFHMVQGRGLISNAGFELLFSDLLLKLYNSINPFAQQSEYTELECSVINAEIKSGKVLVNPLVFHTQQITLLSNGHIDLATEQIDMNFNTKAREGVGISVGGLLVNPFTKLGGSLSSPSIELDPTGAAVSGGVAVATLGLSLLAKPLYYRFLSTTDPCGEALKHLGKTGVISR